MARHMELLAGNKAGFSDGAALTALLDQPTCVSLAPNGNIWIVDRGNVRIRCLEEETVLSSLTGTRTSPYQVQTSIGGTPTLEGPVTFHVPSHLAHGRNGEAFVVDSTGTRIRKMVSGQVVTVVENSIRSYSGGWDRRLDKPNAVRVDHLGDVWIANTGLAEVLHVKNAGDLLNVGNSLLQWKTGIVHRVGWTKPTDMAFSVVDPSKVYVADVCSIKILDRNTQELTWYAGQADSGYIDGWRANARFGSCDYLLSCPSGDLIVHDIHNRVLRRISVLGMVSTFVGPNAINPSFSAIPEPEVLPLQPFSKEHKLPTPHSLPEGYQTTFEGKLLELGSCCFNRYGDLIIPDSSTHRVYCIRMAHVPSEIRFQLDLVERVPTSVPVIQTQATRLLTHKLSGTSWNIIDATLALSRIELADVDPMISYLEESSFSPDSIEILLNMLAGRPISFPTVEIAIEVLRCLVDLKLPDFLSENSHSFAKVFIASENIKEQTPLVSAIIDRLRNVFNTATPSFDPEVEAYLNRPYSATGFLREQVERLYWSTVWNGFPSLPQRPDGSDAIKSTFTVSGDEIPASLRPNLEISTFDGGVVSCHDWVLVPRWKFIRHMFVFGGEESQSRRVSLEDVGITSDALRYILYYMYTDRLDLLKDDHLRLSIHKWSAELYLTDFEDVALPGCERLITHTFKSFAQPLTVENVVPTYRASIEGASAAHEMRALKFMAQKLKSMMESDRRHAELQTLPPEALAKIVFLHFGREYQGVQDSSTPEASAAQH